MANKTRAECIRDLNRPVNKPLKSHDDVRLARIVENDTLISQLHDKLGKLIHKELT